MYTIEIKGVKFQGNYRQAMNFLVDSEYRAINKSWDEVNNKKFGNAKS